MIDQVHRQVRVKTALPDSTFTVKSAQISEEISAPFDMQLEVYSDEAELAFDDYTTVLAHCRIDGGREHLVPYTLLPPVD